MPAMNPPRFKLTLFASFANDPSHGVAGSQDLYQTPKKSDLESVEYRKVIQRC